MRLATRRWTEGAGRWLAAILLVLAAGCGPGMGSIGAIMTRNHSDGRLKVRQVPADMEASKAGMQPGDEILYIDGRDVRSLTAEEVHQAFIGAVGTTVDVTVVRDGKVFRLLVKRGPLK
ncbi:MAG: PDZ domain-containing protein [Deltaproteobacteria bacterium]|nr:PDZ domain-containing protein [Deltaproteobacteria bacterium]